jgi:hypothetical protein
MPYGTGVERTERRRRPPAVSDDMAAPNGSALRDAAEIVVRAQADEAAADEARERYRREAMAPLEPDRRIAPLLARGEAVLAVRRSAVLERRQPVAGTTTAGPAGDLYLTSRRLVLLGRHTITIALGEVEEVMLAGERLLLVLRDGRGASLDVDRPRLLRVQLAVARAKERAGPDADMG